MINQILALIEKIEKCSSSMWVAEYAMGLVLLRLRSYPTATAYLQQAKSLMLEQIDKEDERIEEITEIISLVMQPQTEDKK